MVGELAARLETLEAAVTALQEEVAALRAGAQ
jgi:outer membrane murein-binding lipoprotein Lpp